MIERIHVSNVKAHVGEEVTLAGFVHTLRDQNKIAFIILRDITGLIQVVALSKNEGVLDAAKELSLESVVTVRGRVKEEAQAPGGVEIEALEITTLSKADPDLPIPVIPEKAGGEANQQARLDYRWIDLRQPEKARIFKVWMALEEGMRAYWIDSGYQQFYSPSFMGTPSETGAEVFAVDYFDRNAYLAQSPQFYKQMAIASGFERVFCTGPVFRAEHSFTSRHLTEFTGWDIEVGFVESHHDVMDELESALVRGFANVNERVPSVNVTVPTQPFPRITLAKAKEILAKRGVGDDDPFDLSPEEERELWEWAKEEHNHDFVFVHEYPKDKRAFYHMRLDDKPNITKGGDLIYKGLEIVTFAQREHRYDVLVAQAKEKGMDTEGDLRDYVNFFRYGCPPHGGGGIGPSRIVMRMLDLSNIREATFLPRDVKRLHP